MYSTSQVLKGILHPSAAVEKLRKDVKNHIKRRKYHDYGVQGSYETGNIGDLALGMQFKYRIQNAGYTAEIFRKETVKSKTPNRVLGGGGVLHDWYGTDHLKRRLSYVSSGENGYIIGVGVPGFKSSEARELASEVLPNMDMITVRDQWSKNNIEAVCDVDVEVTACPAFLYDDPDAKSTGRTGINFRPYFDQPKKTDAVLKNYFEYEDLENANDRYIANAKRICDSVDKPVFIPFHQRDEEFARKHLDIPIYPYELSVEKTLRRISEVDRVVATRYHSLIFAAICDKPILALAYEPKVRAIADRLHIPSYKPHTQFSINFHSVSNVSQLKELSRKNFSFLPSTSE